MNIDRPFLITEEIQKTIQRLHLRIRERFPDCDLANVCEGLYRISQETHETVKWIGRPNYLLRLVGYLAIALAAVLCVLGTLTVHFPADGINIADVMQAADAALDSVVLIGAGVIFLVTLENRRKRQRVIHAINRLRCVAHIIDMHQLTKAPDALKPTDATSPQSPSCVLTEQELARYLNYCTEMLALVSKTGFLYVQDFHDPVATEAANDLEDLTSGLIRKIWQKIMVIPSTPTRQPPTPLGDAGI